MEVMSFLSTSLSWWYSQTTSNEIKEKKYSFSAGQYFDIKIDYVDITEEEFNRRMTEYKSTLAKQFEESHKLEEEIMKQLASLKFNEDVKGK